MLRTLLVDDEPHVRENLRLRLQPVPDVQIVGECSTGHAAIDAIRTETPDLVFLDVQMPGCNGLEVLRTLDAGALPLVIFVTAYDAYAVNAFEVNAVDYLLKPIDADRFAEALQRAREQQAAASSAPDALDERLQSLLDTLDARDEPPPKGLPGRLIVKSRGRVRFVEVDAIDYVAAAGDYVELHTGDTVHVMRETMAALAERLGPHFRRIHRSTIVNLRRVAELRATDHGEYVVFLQDDTRLKLSRTYRERLQDALGTSL